MTNSTFYRPVKIICAFDELEIDFSLQKCHFTDGTQMQRRQVLLMYLTLDI